MILIMPLTGSIVKRSNDKYRRKVVNNIRGRQVKGEGSRDLLVAVHFYHLHLVPAAAMRFMHMHTAFPAFLTCYRKELHGSQPVHAIVGIDNHPAGDSQVREQYYYNACFFHEPCKDTINRSPAK